MKYPLLAWAISSIYDHARRTHRTRSAGRRHYGAAMLAVAYLGALRETPVQVDVVDLGCGAARVPCFECGGTGDWTPYYPEPERLGPGGLPCIACKGTGAVLIAV